MTPWQRSPHHRGPALVDGRTYDWKLDEVPLDRLVLRPTAVLDVPGEDRHEITAEDIDRAVARGDLRDGDDVLVRTGWATTDKAYDLGDQYCLLGPSWTYEGCVRMAELMDQHRCGVFMTDAPLIMTPLFQGWGWSTGPERMRPKPKPWPSIEARERLMKMDHSAITIAPPEIAGQGGYLELIEKAIAICKCLVDADQISGPRVKMIMMPLRIRDGGASPCRFVAAQ